MIVMAVVAELGDALVAAVTAQQIIPPECNGAAAVAIGGDVGVEVKERGG
jgi:hypothetical protein